MSGDIDNEIYCKGTERYVYFRCENDEPQLTWNISPLFEMPVQLSTLNAADNIIRLDGVSIFVDSVSQDPIQIISYLWLNLGQMDSVLNVSCNNEDLSYRVFKPSGTYGSSTLLFS